MRTVTYLLPIKSAAPHRRELTEYLRQISEHADVLVVDASPEAVFDDVHAEWSEIGDHVRPDPDLRCRNGKVHGVLSGLARVDTPLVVIADDDVRYGACELQELTRALERADLVLPQNYFESRVWHARWDTARTLINRSFGTDFPGTLGVRTDFLRDGYDGDVLFENLQLTRTVAARGGSIEWRPDLYVRRLPPTTPHFMRQRVRQAYDELARPARLLVALSVIPGACLLAARRRWAALGSSAALVVALAEVGRRRHDGRRFFSSSAALWAPLWVLERGICSWAALFARVRGGVRYADARLVAAATEVNRRMAPG